MKSHLLLKITVTAALGVLAIILYADLQSVHQIYRITQATINAAPDGGTWQIGTSGIERREDTNYSVGLVWLST